METAREECGGKGGEENGEAILIQSTNNDQQCIRGWRFVV
jgi:hypothetical protein